MMTQLRLGLAAALGIAAIVAPAVPAMAQPADQTLDGVKAAVTARIDMRLATLNRDAATVTSSTVLTEEHRSHLSSTISGSTSGLTALKAKVAGETTVSALRDDAASMVNDYRVYALVGPQVRLAIAGDFGAAAIVRAQEAHDRLAEAVAEKKAGGADTSAAETDLEQMQSAIDAATGHLDGVVDALLAVEPSPDGPAIRGAVSRARAAIVDARGELRIAAAEGRAVLAFLRR